MGQECKFLQKHTHKQILVRLLFVFFVFFPQMQAFFYFFNLIKTYTVPFGYQSHSKYLTHLITAIQSKWYFHSLCVDSHLYSQTTERWNNLLQKEVAFNNVAPLVLESTRLCNKLLSTKTTLQFAQSIQLISTEYMNIHTHKK